MKKKISIFIFIFYLFLLTTTYSLYAQKVKIKKEKGVIVVYNPKTPVATPETLTELILKEDLSIGEKNRRQEEMFVRIQDLDVDREENIYILDQKDHLVKIFNINGEFIRKFGKRGQGPGEMQTPTILQITAQNEIMIYDLRNRRLTFFALNGKYLRQISTASLFSIVNIKMDSKGNIIGCISNINEYGIKKFDSSLKVIMTIIRIIREPRSSQALEFSLMSPSFHFTLTQDDNIIWGYSNEYELNVVAPDGKILRKIVKAHDPVKLTEKEKKKLIYLLTSGKGFPKDWNISIPKYSPPFMNLSVDEEGRLFVGTYEKEKNKLNSYNFDVFDSKGRYISQVPIELKDYRRPLIWKKKKLYIIDETNEGYPVVRRFKVIWQ